MREAKVGQDTERLLPVRERRIDALSVLESHAQKVQRATLTGAATKLPVDRQGPLSAMDGPLQPAANRQAVVLLLRLISVPSGLVVLGRRKAGEALTMHRRFRCVGRAPGVRSTRKFDDHLWKSVMADSPDGKEDARETVTTSAAALPVTEDESSLRDLDNKPWWALP